MAFNPLILLAQLVACLTFLTRLPIPFARTLDLPRLSASMGLFGVAGAIIGALLALALTGLLALGVPKALAAGLAILFGLLATGALHEDGLADVADGFGGGRDKAQRLQIMRDSRIGSYGTMALIMALGLKLLALAEIARLPWPSVVILCAAAGAFSRAMVVDLMWSTNSARMDGLSVMAGRPGRLAAITAIVTALGIAALSALMFRSDAALFAVAAATLTATLLRTTAIRLIDGQTGDVCGAVQVAAELAMLIVFASMVR
jgi:adenosylcobinamide-GDP ribazoletransferase